VFLVLDAFVCLLRLEVLFLMLFCFWAMKIQVYSDFCVIFRRNQEKFKENWLVENPPLEPWRERYVDIP